MTRKSCPFFNCTNVIKHGLQNGRQRYRCASCGHTWANVRRPSRQLKALWRKYAFDGRNVRDLAREYGASKSGIRRRLAIYTPPHITQKPRTVAVIMDVTYFGSWAILVVIDPYANDTNGENTVLYYALVDGTEKTRDYEAATDTIESMGYSIIAVTIDGRRGVRNMLEARGIPVQLCQFHQLMTITQCLTKRPRLVQNIELRKMALTLSKTNETAFEEALAVGIGGTANGSKSGIPKRNDGPMLVLGEPILASLETYHTYSFTNTITYRNIQSKPASLLPTQPAH